MNQIPIYQHPFVDVFKATKLNDWQLGQKEGDVTEIYDKTLAKNVIKVSGITPASNYFQLPAQKNLTKKSLGLIGKYVYSFVNIPPGKTFVIHFDYIVNETRLVRISLSNIYKEFKNLNGNSIQIPIEGVPFSKWTVLCINAYQILADNQVFASGQKHAFYMRSLQVTANVQIKGIYTSDIKYTVSTLPKDMALKVLKGQDWFSLYHWFEYPQGEGGADAQDIKENVSQNTPSMKTETKAALKSKSQGAKAGKSVKFNEDITSSQQVNSQEEFKEVFPTNGLSHEGAAEYVQSPDVVERTLQDIETIKNDYQLAIEEKHLQSKADVTFFYDQEASIHPKPIAKVQRTLKEDEFFILKPNPIMKLERSIGIHPRFTSSKIFFNNDAKLSREILYTSANLLLGYQHSNQRQRLFYDHPTSSIEFFHVEGNFAFTATRSLEEGSKDLEISIWDVQEARLIFSFKPPIQSMHSITLNKPNETEPNQYLCFGGKDFQKRDLILIYNFHEIVLNKKVEIYARQLCDFDMTNIRFNDAINTSLIACGRENIRFFKIKNGHLPGQSVTLNNTGRGKVFNSSIVDYTLNDKGQAKANFVYVTTNCGLLYIVNYSTRQVDKIIQIHEEKVTTLLMAPNRNFIATASINGYLRLWSPDFSKLISEVNTQQNIVSCDINHKEITVLSAQGMISILDMEESTFNVVIRSHLENINDLCFNKPGIKLVTVGQDQKIYIWNSETLEVLTEFSTSNDMATKIASSSADSTVAIGFKSGFIRIFDLSPESQGKLLAETMIFESPVMDLQYSSDNRFLVVFYKSCRIVIFSVEKGYQPVKNIDYEFPNENYFSLCFSPDVKYLANISSNANNITVWETKNFSLKFHIDLTGDVISKIRFAPNGKDLVLLTTSSKLKFYRITFNELLFNKEIYGVTDLECLDFEISPNNKYIACCGKEGVVKIYDYFMRGAAVPNYQAFIGHFRFPRKVYWQEDMRFLFTIGDGNGLFRWSFFGDKEFPSDMSKHFEELQVKPKIPTHTNEYGEPTFNHDELLKMTHQQVDQQYLQYSDAFNPGLTREVDQMLVPSITLPQQTTKLPQSFGASVQYNTAGYRFEQYDIELKKVLQCSIGKYVKNNLVWNKERRYIAYTSQNFVIVEDLNQEKTQRLLKEGNDKLYQLKLSPNNKYLLAFTHTGNLDGFPTLYLWDAVTLKKLNQIAINDEYLISVEFSLHSNMLLVLSKSLRAEGSDAVSTIAVWDFLEGHRDVLCQSHMEMEVIEGKWNMYIGGGNEFVTVGKRGYHYWKIANNLTLQYQPGDLPKPHTIFNSQLDHFTTCEFLLPTQEQLSVYLLLALSTGTVILSDARCNQHLMTVKLLDSPIRSIHSSNSRLLIESNSDQLLYCYPQGTNGMDRSDPQNIFSEHPRTLTLDGSPQATHFDEAGAEGIVCTSSGTIWYVNWMESATIKIKSCHSPVHELCAIDYKYVPPSHFQVNPSSDSPMLEFDQNYLVATSGKDGIIKLWNLYDSEFVLQFIVPKEECVAISMHQFKPYMVGSFTDGFLRFFEIEKKNKILGRCQIQSQEGSMVDYLVSVKILPSGNHILGASRNGQIVLIYIEQWEPLAIKIEQIASINTTINTFDVSFLEPYNKWLIGTANGKVIVYNRKDFNAFQQEIFNEENPPRFNYMDSFNVLDYVDNQFTESKRANTLDHYYSVAKRNLVTNEVDDENRCEGVFSNADLTLHISFIKKSPHLFIRNFELHQVVRRMNLTNLPLSLSLTPTNPSLLHVLQQDGLLKLIDLVNPEGNTTEILTTHGEGVRVMRVCPNGRYVITGGRQGDVCVWGVRKKRVEEVLQGMGLGSEPQ